MVKKKSKVTNSDKFKGRKTKNDDDKDEKPKINNKNKESKVKAATKNKESKVKAATKNRESKVNAINKNKELKISVSDNIKQESKLKNIKTSNKKRKIKSYAENSSLKIRVTDSLLSNFSLISDEKTYKSPEIGGKYLLVFTDGKNTIKAFKEIYVSDEHRRKTEFIFYVKNLEYFMDKMREFRNLEIEINSGEKEKDFDSRYEKYKKIESLHKGKNNGFKDFKNKVENKREINFYPDIFSSIKTSLLRPDLYLSKESTTTEIFKIIYDKKMVELNDLKKEMRKGPNCEIDDIVRSMISCNLIKNKDGKLVMNEVFY